MSGTFGLDFFITVEGNRTDPGETPSPFLFVQLGLLTQDYITSTTGVSTALWLEETGKPRPFAGWSKGFAERKPARSGLELTGTVLVKDFEGIGPLLTKWATETQLSIFGLLPNWQQEMPFEPWVSWRRDIDTHGWDDVFHASFDRNNPLRHNHKELQNKTRTKKRVQDELKIA